MEQIMQDYSQLMEEIQEKKDEGNCSEDEVFYYEQFQEKFIEQNYEIQQLRAKNVHLDDEIKKSQKRIDLISKDYEEKKKIIEYLNKRSKNPGKKK